MSNPWDVQASSPVAGAINEGDLVMLMYYARAEEAAEGGSKLTARIQLNSPPWTSVLESTAPITAEWKSYCAFRVATASIAEKKSNVSIHLATAQQVIDLGPVLVFNFGKGFDQSKLSFCAGWPEIAHHSESGARALASRCRKSRSSNHTAPRTSARARARSSPCSR